jgi:hypothetical protein
MTNENFKLACKILGKQRASYALKRMAKKMHWLNVNELYGPRFYEKFIDVSMNALGPATSWFKCPKTYKANQRALHALRACLNW